jgi:hypothetical protein
MGEKAWERKDAFGTSVYPVLKLQDHTWRLLWRGVGAGHGSFRFDDDDVNVLMYIWLR